MHDNKKVLQKAQEKIKFAKKIEEMQEEIRQFKIDHIIDFKAET
jgi:hypothetical protein